jgi:hypothetical protein
MIRCEQRFCRKIIRAISEQSPPRIHPTDNSVQARSWRSLSAFIGPRPNLETAFRLQLHLHAPLVAPPSKSLLLAHLQTPLAASVSLHYITPFSPLLTFAVFLVSVVTDRVFCIPSLTYGDAQDGRPVSEAQELRVGGKERQGAVFSLVQVSGSRVWSARRHRLWWRFSWSCRFTACRPHLVRKTGFERRQACHHRLLLFSFFLFRCSVYSYVWLPLLVYAISSRRVFFALCFRSRRED